MVETDLGELATVGTSLREKKSSLDRFKLLPGEFDFTRLMQRQYVRWVIGLIRPRDSKSSKRAYPNGIMP